MKTQYYFGRVPAKQIDCFAYPRTGSHFLNYCCQGLFDLVWLPTPGLNEPETVDRQRELDPAALCALDLREDGVPYAPVYINHRANGQHGTPIKGDAPVLILIREPIASVYSFYNVALSRWGMADRIRDPVAWVAEKLARYHAFYEQAFSILAGHPKDSLLIRFEELAHDPDALVRLVDFVGVRPKLSPEYVHRMTRFETLVRPGERTFYRLGNNEAWRDDAPWRRVLERIDMPDFGPFGYPHTRENAPSAGGRA